MGERFSEELRREAEVVWSRIKSHPFVVELPEGRLPKEKFIFYLRQGHLFIIEYCRLLGLAVAKASRMEDIRWFS